MIIFKSFLNQIYDVLIIWDFCFINNCRPYVNASIFFFSLWKWLCNRKGYIDPYLFFYSLVLYQGNQCSSQNSDLASWNGALEKEESLKNKQ